MARYRTLAEIRQEVYDRADVDENYITPAQMTRLVNSQLARLYRLLVKANKSMYLESRDVTVVSGTENYDLTIGFSPEFWRLVGLDFQDGQRWFPVKRFNFSERLQYQDSGDLHTTRYMVAGDNLKLRPAPAWGGTMRVWYIPAPELLVNDADQWQGFAGFEEYAIVCAVIAIKSQQEEDVQAEMLEQKALYADIHHSATARDDNEPPRWRDVTREAYLDDWPTG